MVYTKRGPFVDASPTGPYLDAGFFNAVEAALTGVTAPAPSGGDDTAALTAWLATLTGPGTLAAGTYRVTGSLTIPAGADLFGYGAILRATSGSFDMVNMSANSGVYGLEIDGNQTAHPIGGGVVISGVTNVTVADCYIHDTHGVGVSAKNGASWYRVTGNTIFNLTSQAISISAASYAVISGNRINGCSGGVQWWGGDSAIASTVGISHLTITGNVIQNVSGGIWGSLGQYVSVTGNDLENISDVGIDFEGCLDCTATGNTVHNATNSGLSVFYGSSRIVFTGNTVLNDAAGSTGNGFKAYTSKTNTRITVVGNTFTTLASGVTSDASALSNSRIVDNDITVSNTTGSMFGVNLLDDNANDVIGNRIVVASATGIRNQGGSDCRIEGNQVTTSTDTTTAGAQSAGIYLFWRSATYSAKRNRVRNNVVVGFVQGIYDSCSPDLTSYNLIENNVASTVYRSTGAGYTGVINNNRSATTHAAVTPVAQ